MKNLFFLSLLSLSFLVSSCSKDDDTQIQQQPATIAAISPSDGIKGTEVTITGTNFGTNASVVEVFFNGVQAMVNQVTNTQIKAIVPPRAYTGNVAVKINGNTLQGPIFTYIISDVQVSTFAGSSLGSSDGTTTTALFNTPTGIAIASDGTKYIIDRSNHRIRKISPEGVVSTLAGSTQGDLVGVGTNAKFNSPLGITIGSDNNLYVTDFGNHKIKKVTPQGEVTVLAGSTGGYVDGQGSTTKFTYPFGICSSPDGTLYVADSGNYLIRKVTLNGLVTTFAGSVFGDVDATGISARFKGPTGVTFANDGNLYVVDNSNHKIRKIQPDGKVTTFAGNGISGSVNGIGINARFNYPHSIIASTDGNLYISDLYNHRIRKMNIETRLVNDLAGEFQGFFDGSNEEAAFNEPNGLALDIDGNLYIADFNNHKIRKITQE